VQRPIPYTSKRICEELTLKGTFKLLAFAACASIVLVGANAQRTSPQPRIGSAENALIGIALFDPGTRVIAKFGSPDRIEGLTVDTAAGPADGGGAARGGGPAGGGGGAASPGASRGGGGGAGAPATSRKDFVGEPFSDAGWLRQTAGTMAPPPSDDSDGGRGGSGSTGGSSRGGGGGAGSGGGGGQKVIYTRWVYNRGGSRYAFVLDKFNRVSQIEAVGLSNRSVRTKRGISFGSSFGTIINKYNAPDGYEINGDNIVVRFLVRDRVAFKLSRVNAKKPHVVTGIVVAAGKT